MYTTFNIFCILFAIYLAGSNHTFFSLSVAHLCLPHVRLNCVGDATHSRSSSSNNCSLSMSLLMLRRDATRLGSCWATFDYEKPPASFGGGNQIDKNNWLQRRRLRLQCNRQHRRRWRSNSVEFSVWHELQSICLVHERQRQRGKERERGNSWQVKKKNNWEHCRGQYYLYNLSFSHVRENISAQIIGKSKKKRK